MDKELIFATANAGKLREVFQILSEIPYELISLSDIGWSEEIEETGTTFVENALIKARTIYKATDKNVFADDSGLEVISLGMEPGVYSARYAGSARDSQANMDKLLHELEGVQERSARFISVMALIINGQEYLFEGVVNGKIAYQKLGEGGFGYDPIFIPYGHEKTFAELSDEIKNGMSHRSRAIERMEKVLQK